MSTRSEVLAAAHPCARLLRLGAAALSNAELVALVIDANDSEQSVGVGRDLINDIGGIDRLPSAFPEELTRTRGVDAAGAARLLAAFELASRSAKSPPRRVLDSPAAIAAVVSPLLAHERREKVVVVVADAANRLLRVVPVATGGLDACSVPVREILHAVLRYDGRVFALAHNHPSGDPVPSSEDRATTEAICRAADATGLRFLGHMVIGGRSWRVVR